MIDGLNFSGQKFNHQKNAEQTNTFFCDNSVLSEKINDLIWAYNDVGDVIPQYSGKFGSGHKLPYSESFFELECSYQLLKLSFYKYAFIALRNALELGLLSVYWDRNDDAEKIIKEWHNSNEDTPFKRQILNGLLCVDNIKEFCKHYDIIDRAKNIYGDLSAFAHTKGYSFSSHNLNNANFTKFNQNVVFNWTVQLENVVQLLLILHVLKYPVALQNTPLEQKFGINIPYGGFLDIYQSDRIKAILNPEELKILQQISNKDENAKVLFEWVNSHPDISDKEFKKQLLDFDKDVEKINSAYNDKTK